MAGNPQHPKPGGYVQPNDSVGQLAEQLTHFKAEISQVFVALRHLRDHLKDLGRATFRATAHMMVLAGLNQPIAYGLRDWLGKGWARRGPGGRGGAPWFGGGGGGGSPPPGLSGFASPTPANTFTDRLAPSARQKIHGPKSQVALGVSPMVAEQVKQANNASALEKVASSEKAVMSITEDLFQTSKEIKGGDLSQALDQITGGAAAMKAQFKELFGKGGFFGGHPQAKAQLAHLIPFLRGSVAASSAISSGDNPNKYVDLMVRKAAQYYETLRGFTPPAVTQATKSPGGLPVATGLGQGPPPLPGGGGGSGGGGPPIATGGDPGGRRFWDRFFGEGVKQSGRFWDRAFVKLNVLRNQLEGWPEKIKQTLGVPFLAGTAIGAGLGKVASPDAFQTLVANLQIAAAKIGKGLIPSMVFAARTANDVGNWWERKPEWFKEGAGTALGIGIAGGGLTLLAASLVRSFQVLSAAALKAAATLAMIRGGPGGMIATRGGRKWGFLGPTIGAGIGAFIGSEISSSAGQAMGLDPTGSSQSVLETVGGIGGLAAGAYGTSVLANRLRSSKTSPGALTTPRITNPAAIPGHAYNAQGLPIARPIATGTGTGPPPVPSRWARMRAGVGGLGRLAGRLAWPIAVATEMANIESSEDPLRDTVPAGGWIQRQIGEALVKDPVERENINRKWRKGWHNVKTAVMPIPAALRSQGVEVNPANWMKSKEKEDKLPISIASRVEPQFVAIEDAWRQMQLAVLKDPAEQKLEALQLECMSRFLDTVVPSMKESEKNTSDIANKPNPISS